MATEVSRPPEYARTTLSLVFSAMIIALGESFFRYMTIGPEVVEGRFVHVWFMLYVGALAHH